MGTIDEEGAALDAGSRDELPLREVAPEALTLLVTMLPLGRADLDALPLADSAAEVERLLKGLPLPSLGVCVVSADWEACGEGRAESETVGEPRFDAEGGLLACSDGVGALEAVG